MLFTFLLHLTFLCREWATHSLPTLILLGIFLYVDRVIRAEMIFDSSALTCTVFVTHILNVCRSKIAHIDDFALSSSASAFQLEISNASSFLSPNPSSAVPVQMSHAHSLVSWWWWQNQLIFWSYCIVSVLLLLDVDVSAFAIPSSKSSPLNSSSSSSCSCLCSHIPSAAVAGSNSSSPTTVPKNSLRVSTVVTHCLFVGMLLQIPVNREEFMLPWKVLVRSFTFVLLSICWTYSVGIQEASAAHRVRSFPYFYNPVLQGKLVQPFTPCQLRFLVVLFLDGWILLATSLAMSGIVMKQVSVLVSQVASTQATNVNTILADESGSAHHESADFCHEVFISADSAALESEQQQHANPATQIHRHRSDFTGGGMAAAPRFQRQQGNGMPLLATDSMASLGVVALPMTSVAEAERDDETLAMFKMARKAASARMGEQI